jgi:hypothetical protein
MAAPARAIDLDCETLAGKMVARLASEGLLLKTPGGEQRARGIALDSCKMAEGSAQQQLEASKKSWLNNWLLEDTGGKPGNKRLKNLKN